MRYCLYRDVHTGKYDCNYADVVNNTVVCTSKECKYGSSVYETFENSLDDEDIVDYPRIEENPWIDLKLDEFLGKQVSYGSMG